MSINNKRTCLLGKAVKYGNKKFYSKGRKKISEVFYSSKILFGRVTFSKLFFLRQYK